MNFENIYALENANDTFNFFMINYIQLITHLFQLKEEKTDIIKSCMDYNRVKIMHKEKIQVFENVKK